MFLIASPVNADILRMYFIFVLLLPAVLWALMNNRLRYVVAISGGLWLAAALGYGMTALPAGTGYFDIASWQLLFVAGVYFGFTPMPHLAESSRRNSWIAVCIAVAATFFAARHWHLLTGQESSPYLNGCSTGSEHCRSVACLISRRSPPWCIVSAGRWTPS